MPDSALKASSTVNAVSPSWVAGTFRNDAVGPASFCVFFLSGTMLRGYACPAPLWARLASPCVAVLWMVPPFSSRLLPSSSTSLYGPSPVATV